nr:hypothetical protein [Ruegeria sp. HKCCE3926]
MHEKLPTLPPAAIKTVAARVALQWLPYIFGFFEQGSDRTDFQQFLLLCLRACVVSGLEGTRPSAEVNALNAHLNSRYISAADTGRILNILPKSASIASNAIRIATNEVDIIISSLPTHLTAYHGEGLKERTADTAALTVAPEDTEQVFATKLWHGEVPETHAGLSQQFFDNATGTPWEFWAEWYKGMLNGNPLDWELQRRVALIDNSIWLQGPEAIATETSRIELPQQIVGSSLDQTASQVSRSSTLVSSIRANRDAIAVSAVSLIEQIEYFRERVRGLNTLEPRLREEVVEFADYLESTLSELVNALPITEDELNEDSAGRIALWLRNYKDVLFIKLAHYSSPENVAEATVPTSIVLGSTAIGAMLGLPLVGATVGGLITNQLKPAQAAKELLKRTEVEEIGNK